MAVAVGIRVEGLGTPEGAEVERSAVVFTGGGGCVRVDQHSADGVGDVCGGGCRVIGVVSHLWSFAGGGGWRSGQDELAGAVAEGRRSLLSSSALTATMTLEPDMEMAAISGLSMIPREETKTPAAIGSATAL